MSDEKTRQKGGTETGVGATPEAGNKPAPKPSGALTDDLMMTKALYPNAAAIFSGQPKSLDSIKNDCLFVLDTNVLLLPFGVGKQSLEQLRKVYADLISRGQLVVPGHAAREFAKNRSKKLAELYQFVSRRRGVVSVESKSYPLLEGSDDYKKVIEIEKQINAMSSEYNRAINSLLERIASWRWDDPVSCIYKDLFTKAVVYDPDFEISVIKADLDRRQIHKLPPGYKDGNKEENAAGDLLIWHTILKAAEEKQKSVVFVSGDLKADWWTPSEGKGLYPRYELIDEFRHKSNGGTLHIIELSQLLNLFGANHVVVQEVRNEESQVKETVDVVETSYEAHERPSKLIEFEVRKILMTWLMSQADADSASLQGADGHWATRSGERFVVSVAIVKKGADSYVMYRQAHRLVKRKLARYFNGRMLICVFLNKDDIYKNREMIDIVNQDFGADIRFVCGCMENNHFVQVNIVLHPSIDWGRKASPCRNRGRFHLDHWLSGRISSQTATSPSIAGWCW
ncbi:MAG: hypothetical protein EOP84_10905 [Verrucomicrobiaceae bacterium]|nr:MAG: hypothetical protein EOP84_10905 [Verrucomicrobiaceae bacterium]